MPHLISLFNGQLQRALLEILVFIKIELYCCSLMAFLQLIDFCCWFIFWNTSLSSCSFCASCSFLIISGFCDLDELWITHLISVT